MKKTAAITMLVLGAVPVWSDDCSCVYPIDPKACVPICRNALLMKLNKGELMTDVKLNEKTASQIISARKTIDPSSDSRLEKSLPASEVKEIQTKFDKLDFVKGTELVKKYELTNVKKTGLDERIEAKEKDALGKKKS